MTAALRVSGATGHSAAPLGRSGHADNAMKLDLGSQCGSGGDEQSRNIKKQYQREERCPPSLFYSAVINAESVNRVVAACMFMTFITAK